LKKSQLKKSASVFVVLATSASVAWASCGGTEALVSASAASLASSVVAQLVASTSTLVALDNVQTEALISSIKVVAKQVDASGEKSNATIVQGEQAFAAVAKDLADKELADKFVMDFLSQGFEPCSQSTATKNLALAEASVRVSIPERVNSEIEAAGGRFGSPAAALKAREEAHRKNFCTQSEVDAGLCSSLGKLPGGDTNAALLFGTDKSADAVAAKNAFINNVIGLPDAAPPLGAAASPEAAAYLLEKKKKDAFLAWPANSLKSIQVEGEAYKSVMDERVGQYFGTKRAADWARDQAGQAQRGVIVDLVKIQGLQLKVRERRIRENLRLEANFAALLELENQRVNSPQAQRASQQIANETAAGKVK